MFDEFVYSETATGATLFGEIEGPAGIGFPQYRFFSKAQGFSILSMLSKDEQFFPFEVAARLRNSIQNSELPEALISKERPSGFVEYVPPQGVSAEDLAQIIAEELNYEVKEPKE